MMDLSLVSSRVVRLLLCRNSLSLWMTIHGLYRGDEFDGKSKWPLILTSQA
jgi:hypothetical protein